MAFEVGKRVVAEAESTGRRPRSGVVEEVLRGIRRLAIGSAGTTAMRALIRRQAARSGPNTEPTGNGERRQQNAHRLDPGRSTRAATSC